MAAAVVVVTTTQFVDPPDRQDYHQKIHHLPYLRNQLPIKL